MSLGHNADIISPLLDIGMRRCFYPQATGTSRVTPIRPPAKRRDTRNADYTYRTIPHESLLRTFPYKKKSMRRWGRWSGSTGPGPSMSKSCQMFSIQRSHDNFHEAAIRSPTFVIENLNLDPRITRVSNLPSTFPTFHSDF